MRTILTLLVTAATAPCATILLPDGSPAAGARAVSLAKEHFAHVTGTEFARPVETMALGEDGGLVVTTETAGRWVILHERGWADAALVPETEELRLEPWSEVSGTVPMPQAPGTLVSYHRAERPCGDEDGGSIFWTSTAPVAADGTYTLRHVPTRQGSVGILREDKNERRIQRWRDHVRFVSVPSPGSVHLEGGVPVSGRIVANGLPAVITLASRDVNPTSHALTDAGGRFTIPGVLPGKYRFFARPDLGRATKNIPHRDVEVGTEPLDLGEISGRKPDVETDNRVEFDAGLINRLRAETAALSDRPVEKIWVGELTHPLGNYGARITFVPQPDPDDPTKATPKAVLIYISGESIQKFYPEHDSLGYGFRFGDGPFENITPFEQSLRVFQLKTTTIYLPLANGPSYDDAMALLLAIESETIRPPKSERSKTGPDTWFAAVRGFAKLSPQILTSIFELRAEDGGIITIRTHDHPFGGAFYYFEKLPDGSFEMTGGGSWIS